MKVYLAGGMKGTWQDDLMRLVPSHTYFDPRSHGIQDPVGYTDWDLKHIGMCDVLVAYMDPSNPSGFGLSLEIGFAAALCKYIVFIDQLGLDWRSRYFGMHRVIATCVVPSVESAADALWAGE